MGSNSKAERLVDSALFLGVLVTFSVLMWRLVIAQTIYAGREDGYLSDVLAYMQEIQGGDSGYSFPYPLFFSFGRLLNRFMPIGEAVALATIVLNGLSLIASKYYFEKEIVRRGLGDRAGIHILVTLGIFCCFVMSMWWLPRFGKIHLFHKDQVYVGTFTGNPWHNSTYLATRPFSIIAFFSFIEILRDYETKLGIREMLVFSVSLLLTTLAKPSFTLVLLSTAGVIWVVRLIRSKGKNIKASLLVLLLIIPTVIDLLYQYGGVFGSGNEEEVHGIGFTFFEVWRGHNPHVAEAVFYANVFSLVCLVFMFRELKKDETYRTGVLIFLTSFLEAGLLCEKGFRFTHFNFCWGYMHGIFFFQTVSIIKLIQATVRKKYKWPVLLIIWLALASQVVAGIFYFAGIYAGRDYKTLLPVSWL